MIKDLKFNGAQLGEYSFPDDLLVVYQYVDFNCEAEREGSHVLMSISACCLIIKPGNDEIIVNVPCTSNYEFIVEGELTPQDLMPLWKRSVKHLREACNTLIGFPGFKNMPYPPNDLVKESVGNFLTAWNKLFGNKAGSSEAV